MDTSDTKDRGPGMALSTRIKAELLLLGLLTTGEWEPGL